ncbi:MAG: hypothetical protein A2W19_06620 [Spirochaetes bacterium RBG_16_49_21]|nr:MAG: hypothetical protein A2W19_06620 [Spirochaetes bacterium RBG_16_49_21]
MRLLIILTLGCAALAGMALRIYAEDDNEFKFEESEVEKKPFSIGGYVELFPSLYIADLKSALFRLKYYQNNPGSPYADAYLRLQPELTFEKGIFKAFARAYEAFGYSNRRWPFDLRLYEGYASLKPNQHVVIDAGKKTLKWGKGYAWNPVAFVDRPKNPDDPELAYEGYTVATADFIASFTGPLKTLSFTPVVVPVYKGINENFGGAGHWYFAGKLYLLFFDTDIDFLFFTGLENNYRLGIDVSRNITTNLEVHGEFAYLPGITKLSLGTTGMARKRKINAIAALGGIRYLTEIETTVIIEYYHNASGMSVSEMRSYYFLINEAYYTYRATLKELPFRAAEALTEGAYGRFTPMKNYLYLRVSQKEPFDILYFTPALTVMFNIDDLSFSLTPELLYTGVNNLELRFRYAFLWGGRNSEFGEKPADHRWDLRARYYF